MIITIDNPNNNPLNIFKGIKLIPNSLIIPATNSGYPGGKWFAFSIPNLDIMLNPFPSA